MSRVLLFAAVLAAVALTYWRPLRRVRTALGLDRLLATGHAFFILGYLVGFAFPRPTPLLSDLRPIVAFVAGWVGFSTGMRFERSVLRTLPARAYLVALLPAIAAVAASFGASLALFLWFGGTLDLAIASAMVVGAAAATSAPSLFAVTRSRRAGRQSFARPVLRMIALSAGLDDAIVVVVAILAFALFAPEPHGAAGAMLALGVGGGVLLGWVIWLLLRAPADRGERLLLGLSMLAFCAGFAGWINQSPAGIAAVAAVVLVNLPKRGVGSLVDAVSKIERLAVVVLSTLAGFHISGEPGPLGVALTGVLVVVRLVAKVLAGELVSGSVASSPHLVAAPRWTYGLVPQGTLGLMIALSFFHVWRNDLARQTLAAVAFGGLLNEMLAPWLLLVLLRRLRKHNGPMQRVGRETAR